MRPRERFVFGSGDVHEVRVDDTLRIAVGARDTAVEPERLVAESRHDVERMRHEENRAVAAA
jgi:hypothetical protein